MLTTLILIVIWGLGFAAAVDVVMHGRSAQGTTAWVLALLLIPPLALPFYPILGERRFRGYVRARRSGRRPLDAHARALQKALEPFATNRIRPELRSLARLAQFPFTIGNSLRLLIDGEATYRVLFEEIDRASSYILIQFYIFRDDESGRLLSEKLLAARARGVRVFFMFDEVGCLELPRAYLDTLEAAGCSVSGFRTIPMKRKFLRINFRNHRKVVVVDGRSAMFGGLNIGDEYLGRDAAIGAWRDTHALVRGPAVQCLQMVFVEDWYWAQRSMPEGLEWSPATNEDGDVPVLIFPSSPADEFESGALLFGQLVEMAQSRLWIASPYFVPDEFIVSSLQLAALRGVDVRILVPARADSRLIPLAARSFFAELQAAGVRIFRFNRGFMHQKVVLSDDVAAVGTTNADNRSMRINFELMGLAADPEFAASISEMLRRDQDASEEVAAGYWQGLTAWERLKSRAARLLGPVL